MHWSPTVFTLASVSCKLDALRLLQLLFETFTIIVDNRYLRWCLNVFLFLVGALLLLLLG